MREAIYAGSPQENMSLITVSENGSTRLLDETGSLVMADWQEGGLVGSDSIGARRLARVVLRDWTGNEELASQAAHEFAIQFLVPIAPGDGWLITGRQIDIWLQVWRMLHSGEIMADSA